MSDKAEVKPNSATLQVVLWTVVTVLLVAAIWGNLHFSEEIPTLYRALAVTGVGLVAGFVALQTAKGKAFNQFRKDATVEMRKVVWPTRQETLQTTLIVVVFVLIIAFILFFFDWVLNGLVSQLIG